jgi:hypothetical protein
MSKTNERVIGSSGKSLFSVQHEGLEVNGDTVEAVADAAVISTEFSTEGTYLIKDNTNEDSATVSIINTSGTLSAVKVNGSVGITITADNAATLNVYVLAGVLAVQNLTGGAIDFTVKSYT